MITCLILEDEPMAASLLEEYIQQTADLQLLEKFHTPVDALGFLEKNAVDLIFLDINLPLINGMQFAKLLPEKQMIIFTTAYSDYAIEGYRYNALDYIVKPITFDRFLIAVRKAKSLLGMSRNDRSSNKLYVKSGRSLIQLEHEGIYFIEGLKDYVAFHTTQGKIIAYKKMKDLEESLPGHFSRIHLSYIINRNHIIKIEANHVSVNQHVLPISESYRETFYSAIAKGMI